MLDFIKKVLFYFYNPKVLTIRDSKGKIIDDVRRKRHIKHITKKIENKEIKLEGSSPRCYKILAKGKVVLKGSGNK